MDRSNREPEETALKQFLKREGIYLKFLRNLVRQEGKKVAFIQLSKSRMTLREAIDWLDTPEGVDYWKAYHDKFLNNR